MLIGEYNHNLDAKGRMNFPARFREELGERFYVTRWLDDCLVAFSEEGWQRIIEKLEETPMVKSRDIRRFLYSSAILAEPDAQGRILITQPLREHADLQRDVVVIGVGDHAEIWDKKAWDEMNGRMRSGPVAEAMEALDF